METIDRALDGATLVLLRLHLELTAPRARGDRGDVPGWVLVTVMSAGIVSALYAVAKPELQSMLRTALNSVK